MRTARSICSSALAATVLFFLLLPAFLFARTTEDKEYMIEPNDLLEISVYGEPDLSTVVRVAQDGTISYPFLGNIRASDLTVRELEANISELLGEDYLVNPQVNILIKEFAKISILGAIRTAGSYELKGKMTLSEVIALAGGFQDTADKSKVKIIRSVGREKMTYDIDVDRILAKEAEDVEIRGNDMIIVEEFGRFSIMGQVGKAGVYSLKKGLTVVEAIGLAGGFSNTAAQNGTRVVRVVDGKKQVFVVPVADIIRGGDVSRDIELRAGDTIVVPESFF